MLQGVQLPRIEHIPPSSDNEADEVIDLAASAGLILDPWQEHVLRGALGLRSDGSWSAFEVGLIVARQNGKGAILEAMVLAWLFLFEEKAVLFSAHEMKTAVVMFKRVKGLIMNSPDLRAKVANFYQSNERTAIVLHDGAEARFMARSSDSGRGFSADKIVFDEAFNLPDAVIDAQVPTVGAMDNPQIWYTSSAGDQKIAPCEVLGRVRRRGIEGKDGGLAFFEWSVPFDEQTGRIKGDPADPKMWAMANPSLGIRKRADRIASFQQTMSVEGFAREELSVGNYPDDEPEGGFFTPGRWPLGKDDTSALGKDFALGIAVAVDRKRATIGAAGLNTKSKMHLEPIAVEDGTAWIVAEAKRLQDLHSPMTTAIDGGGPGADLIPALEEAGVRLTVLSLDDAKAACSEVFDLVDRIDHAHLDDVDLNAAVRGAQARTAGDRFLIGRRKSENVTPLEAVTFAAWAAKRARNYDPLDSVL